MATTTKKSVYTKLINVRQKFNESGITKSGVNAHLEFLYLELIDIVPTATKLMQEEGLLSVVNFTDEVATMTIFNNDDAEDKIEFAVPFVRMQPIVSNKGKQTTNEIQALGSSVTYFRRYLYMIALDIAVPDEIDNTNEKTNDNTIIIQNANVYESKESKPTKPATPIERQEIVKEMTKADTTIPKATFDLLKELCVKLRKEHGEKYANLITEISLGTKGFKESDQETIDKYLEALNEAIIKEKGSDWVEVAKRQQAGN